jgi:hypothetical protein
LEQPLGVIRAGRLLLVLSASCAAATASAQSLRFFGNGAADIDRVKIAIDAPHRPADVGSSDFTIELWMKAFAADYPGSPPPCVEGGDSWINGYILVDRDVFGAGDFGDFGVSIYGGRVAFGVAVGGPADTICGTTSVVTGAWRHVALTRNGATGHLRIFVDGVLERTGSGPPGNASYRDGRATSYPTSDPFLVFGAEKHDAGPAYPSYRGLLDEVRLSTTIRYAAPFAPPGLPFTTDAATAALYHFDEGTGTTLRDSSGAAGGPSNGVVKVGGSPVGPLWSTDTPFSATEPPQGPFRFFTLSPCRSVDTRAAQAPALAANTPRTFALAGTCGIPASARAISANVTVVAPAAAGNLRLWPSHLGPPPASAVNYGAGQTRANGAALALSPAGAIAVRSDQASGSVHLILDVNGYFE